MIFYKEPNMQDLHVVLYGSNLFPTATTTDTTDELDIADLFFTTSTARGYEYQDKRVPFFWQTKRVYNTDSLIAPIRQSNPLHLELSIPQTAALPLTQIFEVLASLSVAINPTALVGLSFHLETITSKTLRIYPPTSHTEANMDADEIAMQDVVLTLAPTDVDSRPPQMSTARFTQDLKQGGVRFLGQSHAASAVNPLLLTTSLALQVSHWDLNIIEKLMHVCLANITAIDQDTDGIQIYVKKSHFSPSFLDDLVRNSPSHNNSGMRDISA